MPAEALPVPARLTDLPPGIAMVSFHVPEGFSAAGTELAPAPDAGPPYSGATGVGFVRGAAGELLELIAGSPTS
jgi:hypothetical protein